MRLSILLFYILLVSACKQSMPTANEARFVSEPTATPIQPGLIDEASGMVESRTVPGNLWIEEDSGNPAQLTLLGHDGQIKGRVPIPYAQNVDWEDMAMGPGPQAGINYIYMGDIGDNNAQRPICTIYRFPEPQSASQIVSAGERISFKYPDGPRDAETLIVDPQTGDIWIVSKWEAKVHLYKLPYPQNVNEVTTLQTFGELPITYATGGAISADGNEIIIRTYAQIYYWKRASGQTIADALQLQAGQQLPYRLEPQGEAVCFEKDNKGYFTISEIRNASSVNLYYYARQ